MIVTKKCPHCGGVAEQDVNISTCPLCYKNYKGAVLGPQDAQQCSPQAAVTMLSRRVDQKFCHDCGGVISIRAEICPKCGVRQQAITTAGAAVCRDNPREKTTAALMGMLLGGIGMHQFYLGNNGRGIFYIVFCWTFIPSILGFFEGIQFMLMSTSTFEQKHGGVAWSNS